MTAEIAFYAAGVLAALLLYRTVRKQYSGKDPCASCHMKGKCTGCKMVSAEKSRK